MRFLIPSPNSSLSGDVCIINERNFESLPDNRMEPAAERPARFRTRERIWARQGTIFQVLPASAFFLLGDLTNH